MLAGRTKPIRPTKSHDPIQQLRAALNQSDWNRACDWAVAVGEESREFLSGDLAAEFDATLAAFRQYECGQDDAARSTLSRIRLTSPFLQWKLLLRGLMAYSAGEVGLALDNWRRLSADRKAARLAAPLRARLDPEFRAAQPPVCQRALQSAADKLEGEHFAALRTIQTKLSRPEFLAFGLEQVARLLPRLRRESPERLPMLARACYAAATQGHPDGAAMLKPLFDPPADDPTWSRLQALAAESRGEWLEANRHWQHYQSVLSEHIGFPGDDRARARALIWARCGANAQRQILDEPRGPKPSPDAEGCYRRAIQLDPSFVEASEGLFGLYCEAKRTQEALAVGRRLLELSPEHPDVHGRLAELARADQNLDLAIEHLERAREANPFDRTLGSGAAQLLRHRARNKAMTGDLAGAEADLNAVGILTERVPAALLKCQQAALAFKLGEKDRGDRLAEEASAFSAPAAVWALFAEATFLKLPRAKRLTLERSLASVLYGKPTAGAAADLAEVVFDLEAAPPFYRGYKSHLKRVQAFVEHTICYAAPAAEFQRLCEAVLRLGWCKPLKQLALHGHYKFPNDPSFLYLGARAEIDDSKTPHYYVAESNLAKARKLAEARLKFDPSMSELLMKISEAERRCREASPRWSPPSLLEIFGV